jgi:hypothetical protein
MKVLAVTLFVGLALGSPVDEFSKFKASFGKTYHALEEQERFEVFQSNLEKISLHNSNPHRTWDMKVTEFADLTAEEFKATLSGYQKLPMSGQSFSDSKMYSQDLPESVDWRESGIITDPKNQGSCGSCWAFATVEQVESYAALNNITVDELSTQEITSCTPNTLRCGGSGGCQGSIPQLGYNYIQLFGLTTAKEYPYWSGVTMITGRCKYDIDGRTPVVGITGFNTIPTNDLEATLQHVANVGPLAVAADASLWQLYGSGVFNNCDYDENISINHAIQLVGYGTDAAKGDYWLVRNSWGANWGEHGYIRLFRESETTCGEDTTPMSGTACVGGPGNDVQKVCGMCGVLFDSSYPLGAFPFHK